AARKQEQLARQFRAFENALLRLAQRMETGSPEEKAKAVVLKKAVEETAKQGIDTKFEKLVRVLRESKALDGNLAQLQEIMQQNKVLTEDVRAILDILLGDDRDAKLKADREKAEAFLKDLEQAIRAEKLIRAKVERG